MRTLPNELLREAERLESEASAWRVSYYSKRLPGDVKLLLDLGCGNGYSVTAWRAIGVQAFGVDISRYRMARWVAEHRERRPLVLADARNLPFRPGTFDVVISSGMIEHVGLDHLPTFIEVVARLLRPGGRAVLHTMVVGDALEIPSGEHLSAFASRHIPLRSTSPMPGRCRRRRTGRGRRLAASTSWSPRPALPDRTCRPGSIQSPNGIA